MKKKIVKKGKTSKVVSKKKKVTKSKSKTNPMKKSVKKAQDETTEIICVIDRSTSIRTSGLIEKTIEGFNSFLAEQKKLEGKAKLTLCLFDGGVGYGNTGKEGETYEIRHNGIDLKDVPELNTNTFVPKGMTAMWDAIGATISNTEDRIKKSKEEERPDKVIFLIMTDGEENSSREYNQQTVCDSIKKNKEEKKWAFIFLGANIDTMQVGGSMGVTKGNTMSYSNSKLGVKNAYLNMSKSVSNFRSMATTDACFTSSMDSLIADNGVEKEIITK